MCVNTRNPQEVIGVFVCVCTCVCVSLSLRCLIFRFSPMGYEEFEEVTIARQVVIGGKNKYLINGKTVQQSQVTNLFHSVQLNVNNPHFLIMQASNVDE